MIWRTSTPALMHTLGLGVILTLVALVTGCDEKPRSNAMDFSKTNAVGTLLGDPEKERGYGLEHIFFEKDGLTTPSELNGIACRCLHLDQGEVGYLYFKIDQTFKKRAVKNVMIEVEYFDGKPGILGIEYDASKSKADSSRAYSGLSHVAQLTGTNQWQTVAFQTENATFRNSQNSHADFRLCMKPPEICVRRVTVRKSEN